MDAKQMTAGTCLTWSIFLLMCLTACTTRPVLERTPEAAVEWMPPPTPASSLLELIANLSSDDAMVRIVSAGALEKYGKEAEKAIPALIDNLSYEGPSDVRRAAAIALGLLGPYAYEAVPELTRVLQEENEAYQVRVATADALGKIGDPSAIPALVLVLYSDVYEYKLAARCAKAIAAITGEEFIDAGGTGYRLNSEGIPLIVIDARRWWEAEGQFQRWGD